MPGNGDNEHPREPAPPDNPERVAPAERPEAVGLPEDSGGNGPAGNEPPAPPAPPDDQPKPGPIARIIALSAKNRFVTILFVLGMAVWGAYSMLHGPLDAIPDLSDVQVIIFTDWPGRSPTLVEDQITYPISSTLLSAPHVKSVRGQSFFGLSFVYVVFDEGTDMYWARSRVLEYLNSVSSRLPKGVTPTLGPDATGVGWVYEYALVDETGQHDLQQLRSLQDWNIRFALESVPGVAEVASVGGFVKQYQVNVDPDKLRGYGIPITKVIQAVRDSNEEVGGRVIEIAGHEQMIRGRGYIKKKSDIADIPLKVNSDGTPVYVKDVATVSIGPDMRRGVAELDGKGETVGGIVVMRYGENALKVIDAVKQRLDEVRKGLPPGVKLVVTYDRSGLIQAVDRDPAPHADRGDAGRQHHHLPVPAARAQRAGADPHAAPRRAPGVHPDVLPGADRSTSCRSAGSPSPSVRWWTLPSHHREQSTRSSNSGKRPDARAAAPTSSSRRCRRSGPASSSRCSSSRWRSCPCSRSRARKAGCSNRWRSPRPTRWALRPSWR